MFGPARFRRTLGFTRWSGAALALLASLNAAMWPAAAQKADACRRDAMIVFDASGSMHLRDMEGRTRIEIAREAMIEIMPVVTDARRTGLVVYGPGGPCQVSLKLQPSPDAAAAIIGELIRTKPAGGTPLGLGVKHAADVLGGSGLVVLVTDGEENCGVDPCQLGRDLRTRSPGITVHVIGVRMGPAAQVRASCLATETGGSYTPAGSYEELKHAMTEAMTCPKLSGRDGSRWGQTRWGQTLGSEPLLRRIGRG